MTDKEKQITDFTTNIRLLIQEHRSQKKQIEDMKEKVERLQKKCERQQVMYKALEKDYENLKMAKLLEVGTSDLETARQNINKLIRDVNKCITLINNVEQ